VGIFIVTVGAFVLAALFAERREAEAKLTRSNMMLERERERLARANAMLKRERDNKLMSAQAITAAISHEVRQPLAAIAANASAALRWLGRTPPDHDQVRTTLNRIKGDSHRTGEVFDGFRVLFGKGNQKKQQIDVNEIIRDVLSSLHGELNDHQVMTRPELTSELPLLIGHRRNC
jgi:C4-dicarboxylate-specific signal transduction histidine kinase